MFDVARGIRQPANKPTDTPFCESPALTRTGSETNSAFSHGENVLASRQSSGTHASHPAIIRRTESIRIYGNFTGPTERHAKAGLFVSVMDFGILPSLVGVVVGKRKEYNFDIGWWMINVCFSFQGLLWVLVAGEAPVLDGLAFDLLRGCFVSCM